MLNTMLKRIEAAEAEEISHPKSNQDQNPKNNANNDQKTIDSRLRNHPWHTSVGSVSFSQPFWSPLSS
jgi:hypothetical protein